MSVRQQLRSLWITAVLVIVGVIGIVVFDAERQRGAQQEIASLTSSRMADLERLKATLGYGGLIHDLKNFLIRGDLRYAEGFADSLADARYAIERLRAHHVVGSEEWGALEQIERTAEQYAEAMRYAIEHRPAYAAGGDASWIERLDAEIRVDDTPAMSALSMLRASYVANIERAEDGERATRASFLLSASVVALLGSLLYLLFYFKLTRGLVNPVLKVGPGSQLDASMAADFETIAVQRRKLVTNHHVLGYLAQRFGFTVIGAIVPSGTTLAAPSPSDLESLVGAIETARVPAIFIDSSQPEKLARVLSEQADIAVTIVPLYSESLSPPGTPGATYVDMMRSNTDSIVKGLR